MYVWLRKLLFLMPPETAHRMTLQTLEWIPSLCFPKPLGRSLSCMGLTFAHPVGLAAGLDKNAEHVTALGKLGFSFIEVGTVTPEPQEGNPSPRLFRLLEDEALINRMGFNNRGVDHLVHQVSQHSYSGVLGINIGKNKNTPLEKSADDYCLALSKVFRWADYVTINISSPNTPDLRRLQEEHFFDALLDRVIAQRKELAEVHQRWVPLAVKLSPDENDEQLKRLAGIITDKGIEAIIATNTTADRNMPLNSRWAQETGGLSGKPLAPRATECMRLLKSEVGSAVTLIGAGGIDSAETAQQRLAAGADLLQIYTGLIYKGPRLISQIVNRLMQKD